MLSGDSWQLRAVTPDAARKGILSKHGGKERQVRKREKMESNSFQKNALGCYEESLSARKISKTSGFSDVEKLCLTKGSDTSNIYMPVLKRVLFPSCKVYLRVRFQK